MINIANRLLPPPKMAIVWVVLLQLPLLVWAYWGFVVAPGTYAFSYEWDGSNNLYLLQSYVERLDSGLLRMNALHYPFGDVFWYGDIMPLFAVPYKAICLYIVDISAYVLPVYHLWVILSMVLCSVLVWRILRLAALPTVASIVLAVLLPWVSFEVQRRLAGHVNISQAWPMLWVILLLLRTPEPGTGLRVQLRHSAMLALALLCGAWVHPYYLGILALLAGCYLGLQLGISAWRTRSLRRPALWGLTGVVGAMGFQLMLLKLSDPWHSQRILPAGYNWDYWNARPEALLVPPLPQEWVALNPFPPHTFVEDWGYEGMSYLGLWLLVGLVLWAGLGLLRLLPAVRRRSPSMPGQASVLRWQLLALSGLVLWCVAMGDTWRVGHTRGDNYLSLFFWLHKFSPAVEQFRNVSRFSMPFFWTTAFFTIVSLYRQVQHQKLLTRAVGAFIGLLLLVDTTDRIGYANSKRYTWVTAQQQYLMHLPTPEMGIDSTRYQALLPLPFYHSGSEVRDYIIDSDSFWQNFSYAFVHKTGIPCLCSKMGRTVPAQAALLFHLLDEDVTKGHPLLQQLPNTKPLVVAQHADWPTIHHPAPELYAARVQTMERDFLKRHRAHLTQIGQSGPLTYYSWDWHAALAAHRAGH